MSSRIERFLDALRAMVGFLFQTVEPARNLPSSLHRSFAGLRFRRRDFLPLSFSAPKDFRITGKT
jgi:hypothetical protein